MPIIKMDVHWMKSQRKTFRSDENTPQTKWSTKELPRSVSTTSLRMTPNQTLAQREPKRTWSTPPSTCSASWLPAVFSFKNFLYWVRFCHGWIIYFMSTRWRPTPVSIEYCVMCTAESDTPNETRHRYAGFTHTAILSVFVKRNRLSN